MLRREVQLADVSVDRQGGDGGHAGVAVIRDARALHVSVDRQVGVQHQKITEIAHQLHGIDSVDDLHLRAAGRRVHILRFALYLVPRTVFVVVAAAHAPFTRDPAGVRVVEVFAGVLVVLHVLVVNGHVLPFRGLRGRGQDGQHQRQCEP